MAFAAGDYDRARRCAAALVPALQGKTEFSERNSTQIQTGNLILGRLALHDGDTALAEKYLLAMGHIPGSPALDTFGPNMRLAKDLLATGRRDTVLAYFDECSQFWKDTQLDQWRLEVQQGKMPKFGVSLYN